MRRRLLALASAGAFFFVMAAADTAAAFVSTGDGSWVWQSPLPQGNRINDVHVFNADHLLAVGAARCTRTRARSGPAPTAAVHRVHTGPSTQGSTTMTTTPRPKVRVFQVATGNVGSEMIKRIGHQPDLELVGLHCYSPDKVGRDAGEIVGIVGESGSGKSIAALSLMGLLPPTASIVAGTSALSIEGSKSVNLFDITPKEHRMVRGKHMAMIFQDPMTTLNPAFRVGDQIQESLRIHHIVNSGRGGSPRLLGRGRQRAERERVYEAMANVGIPVPPENARRYPHQFSGGMQQRALTAIALACEPQVLLADEPTTALDVTIQAQIIALLETINDRLGTAVVLVTHNLGLVAEFCERIVVMYAGQLVEQGTTEQVIDTPMHPYTRGLLACLPKIRARRTKILPIPGLVPDLAFLPPGCAFSPRCAEAMSHCSEVEAVPLRSLPDGRQVRCLLYE